VRGSGCDPDALNGAASGEISGAAIFSFAQLERWNQYCATITS
jgi:hypothetical protein